MKHLSITPTPLLGLLRIDRQRLRDERGHFTRLFCADELNATGFAAGGVQMNHTHTRFKGSVRGLHFQRPPHAEDKLVTCLRGSVWDVAVDLRRDSPTFLHWHAEHLSGDNARSLLIPKGFAHGFQTFEDDCEMIYVHSHRYHAAAEGGLRPTDPRLKIDWPLPVEHLSARDAGHPLIDADFLGL